MRMSNTVRVGIAQMNICMPPDKICTAGLGSCIGIILYDTETKVAGLVHIMLPDSTKIKQNQNLIKFADTGIDALIALLEQQKVPRKNLKAKIAGGACMFAFTSKDIGSIGQQNIDAVRNKLKDLEIPIVAEDVGGNVGRTITFDPVSYELEIVKTGKQINII